MAKYFWILQLVIAALLFLAAAGTLINLVLITMRPETISVVNTMIGQGVIIICFTALGHSLLRRGLKGMQGEREAAQEQEQE